MLLHMHSVGFSGLGLSAEHKLSYLVADYAASKAITN